VPAQSGAKARLYSCGECGFADEGFQALQTHVNGVHLGVAV
jgi:hypothetical protein